MDVKSNLWADSQGKFTGKLTSEINLVMLTSDNFATLYFNHCFFD